MTPPPLLSGLSFQVVLEAAELLTGRVYHTATRRSLFDQYHKKLVIMSEKSTFLVEKKIPVNRITISGTGNRSDYHPPPTIDSPTARENRAGLAAPHPVPEYRTTPGRRLRHGYDSETD